MTTYGQLPVYKVCNDLLIATFYLVNHYKREYKYTLGERLKSEVIKTLLTYTVQKRILINHRQWKRQGITLNWYAFIF